MAVPVIGAKQNRVPPSTKGARGIFVVGVKPDIWRVGNLESKREAKYLSLEISKSPQTPFAKGG